MSEARIFHHCYVIYRNNIKQETALGNLNSPRNENLNLLVRIKVLLALGLRTGAHREDCLKLMSSLQFV